MTKSPAEEVVDLREATRQAHEAIKDMRSLVREMKALRDEVKVVAETVFKERMEGQVEQGLVALGKAIEEAIAEAEKAVDHRFDTIASILLGEDGDAKRKGKPTLTELANAVDVVQRYTDSD